LLVINPQEVTAHTGMPAFGDALRKTYQSCPKPVWHWPSCPPKAHAQPRNVPAQDVLNNFIFKRHDRLEATRITLTPTAAKQLPVNAPGLVSLGGEHMQATDLRNAGRESDVGSATGHVGGHCDSPPLPGPGHHFRLFLILSGIQDLVLQAGRGQQLTQMLGRRH